MSQGRATQQLHWLCYSPPGPAYKSQTKPSHMRSLHWCSYQWNGQTGSWNNKEGITFSNLSFLLGSSHVVQRAARPATGLFCVALGTKTRCWDYNRLLQVLSSLPLQWWRVGTPSHDLSHLGTMFLMWCRNLDLDDAFPEDTDWTIYGLRFKKGKLKAWKEFFQKSHGRLQTRASSCPFPDQSPRSSSCSAFT